LQPARWLLNTSGCIDEYNLEDSIVLLKDVKSNIDVGAEN
jgi:hypothetical protein